MNLHFVPTSAEAVFWGAHLRSEARGAHYCQDFEHESPAWQRTILYAKGVAGMELWSEPIGEILHEIQQALDKEYSLDYHLE